MTTLVFTRALDIPTPIIDGVRVVRVPLFAYQAIDCTLPSADCIIAISVPAVRLGTPLYLRAHKKVDCPVVAVGAASARALAQFSIKSIVPKIYNSSGVLALDIFNKLPQGACIQLWRGLDGLDTIKHTLQMRGFVVQECNVYRRILPKNAHADFQRMLGIVQQGKSFVLISSDKAWQHWQVLCNAHGVANKRFCYLTLGERISGIVALDIPTTQIHCIDDLTNTTLAHTLGNAYMHA